VSQDTIPELKAAEPLPGTLDELRQASSHVEEFFLEQCGQIEGALQALIQQEESLDQQRHELAEQQAALAQQQELLQEQTELRDASVAQVHQELERRVEALSQFESQVQLKSAEIQQLRDALESAQAELQASQRQQQDDAQQENHDLQQQLIDSRQENVRLSEQLESLATQRDELIRQVGLDEAASRHESDQSEELREVRGQLETVLAENEALRQRLDEQSSEENAESADERIQELELERTSLELELDAVRARAAELEDAAEEEKRLATEQRAQWTGELRELRRGLERQAQILSQQDRAPASVRETSVVPQSGQHTQEATAPADPVLDSVLAQFQMLQNDRIQRRQNETEKQRVTA
jgi:predicted nuclease with TOPRIM domain